MSTARVAALACASLAALNLCPTPAAASPADYVATPIVEEGERELDFKAGSARARDGSRFAAQSLGFGLGVNAWWFTELYAKWHKEPGERHGFDAFEWENRFQLTETGRYPVDVGMLLEIERPRDRSEGYEVRWGPLLQAEFGSLQANLNLLLEKHVRAQQAGPAELGIQWQLKQRWRPEAEFGVQGFGTVGPWRHWAPSSQQTHVAGPAWFGRFKLGEHQVLKMNAAWLLPLNGASPRQTLRLQAEVEF